MVQAAIPGWRPSKGAVPEGRDRAIPALPVLRQKKSGTRPDF
jgi:hypothetical protein